MHNDYTFALAAALESSDHDIYYSSQLKGIYCGKNTYLGLPIIDGKRLVKVELTQKGGKNTNRKVGIVSNVYRVSETPVSVDGGAFINQNSDTDSSTVYTYNLSNTNSNLRY